MNLDLANILQLSLVILAGVISHVRLESKNLLNEKEIQAMKERADKLDERALDKMTEMSKNIQDLTVQVARLMERVERTNQKGINTSRNAQKSVFDES